MSLFPAYSKARNDDSIILDNEAKDWLANSSFKNVSVLQKPVIDISSDSSEDDDSVEILSSKFEKQNQSENRIDLDSDSNDSEKCKIVAHHSQQHKKEKKKHKHKPKTKVKYETNIKSVYFEDKFRDRINFTINTFHSRARPLYNLRQQFLGFVSVKKSKKHSYHRYHMSNIDITDKAQKKVVISKAKEKKTQDECLPDWCTNLEEEQKLKTQEFNEKLTENPENVELWIQYINFQNDFAKFQKYKSLQDNLRTTHQRQLSIVDKALEKNPNSTELLKLKLYLMSELLPADQFSNDIESLLNKDFGNIILWQALIMAIQASVALCKVPKVLQLYSRCLNTLRKKSRSNPYLHDKQMLGILFECLMFLRHAGYWEQMWETIRMNLSLNFNLSQEDLKFQCSIDEKKLIDMEEVILTSKLPLNQLWLRVESLRERCHWITVDKNQLELIGDSKRFVLSEEVADFVHPLLSAESNFLMGIYFLLSLKVPMLPMRNNTLKNLKLDVLNWSHDSLEILLPMAYPFTGELADQCKRRSLIKGLLENQLTSGPQFLRFHPAQEPFLDFIRAAFRAIGETLSPYKRTSIYVWWLRFERLLIFLKKDDALQSDNRGKKLKVAVKDFLKRIENRNNLHFYREYALIERELGRFDNCVNILETAIQPQSSTVASLTNTDEKAALFSVYRALFETLLSDETYQKSNTDRILKIVSRLVPESAGENRLTSVEKYLENCVFQFLNKEPAINLESDIFMPNIDCDIIVCYTYFLYTTNHKISEILNIFDKCLEHSKKSSNLQEQLYESKTVILQLHFERTREKHDILSNTVREALKSFEDNFYLLSVYADIQCELPCWKLDSRNENIRLWCAIAICLANRARIQKLRNLELFDTANAVLNKLLSFYKTLSRIPVIQCCPLIWRLYMLLLREENLREKKGEEIYHESVMHCPWARSIYIDAAEVAPQVLTQIQDVIREKELRMHVTPEELDILRG